MSIKLSKIYCKHWLIPGNIAVHDCIYPSTNLGEHTIFDIHDSIHYRALVTDNFTQYEKLITSTNQWEHSVDKFKKLYQDFSEDKLLPIEVEYCGKVDKYIIKDGVHRLAILVYKSIVLDKVPLEYLNIQYDNDTVENISMLMRSTTSYNMYNGWNNRIPYHTFQLGDKLIHGQRNITRRLEKVKSTIDFTDKIVFDFGCNIGGVLLQIPEIQKCFGLDYDAKCINVAKNIAEILGYSTQYNFIVHDFDTNQYSTIQDLLKQNHPDIIFLLSMGSWVKSWKTLYKLAIDTKATIIYESNNDKEAIEQINFIKQYCTMETISENSYDDITGNSGRRLYIVKPKQTLKVFITDGYHFKNKMSLDYSIHKNNWTIVNNMEQADIVFSAATYYPIEEYPDKKFIFGPHFSVFPDDVVNKFNNIHNNAIYIQPSLQSIVSWVKEFNFTRLPMAVYPFGVNTNIQMQQHPRDKVLVYYKSRDPKELDYVTTFLKNKGYNFELIKYGQYTEKDYFDKLSKSRFILWVGCHESQGFALEEAMAHNVPLLVWNVKLRKQEYNMREYYKDVKSNVTTIPYWDKRCGEFFYTQDELENTFDKFIKNLDRYQPRKYILDYMTMDKRASALKRLVI